MGTSTEYPYADDLFISADIFIVGGEYGYEGSFLIVGKDSNGIEYIPPESVDRHIVRLPSGTSFSPLVSLHKPRITVTYRLKRPYGSYQGFLTDLDKMETYADSENIASKFVILLYNSQGELIQATEAATSFFKCLTIGCAERLARATEAGVVASHTGLEAYLERTPEVEKFLEGLRNK